MILSILFLSIVAVKFGPDAIRRMWPILPPTRSVFPVAQIIAPVADLPVEVVPEPELIVYFASPPCVTDAVATLYCEPSRDCETVDVSNNVQVSEPSILTASWAEHIALWSEGEGYYLPETSTTPAGWDCVGVSDCDLTPVPAVESKPIADKPAPKPARKTVKKSTVKVSNPYAAMPVTELRRLAKNAGLVGYSKWTKARLVQALSTMNAAVA